MISEHTYCPFSAPKALWQADHQQFVASLKWTSPFLLFPQDYTAYCKGTQYSLLNLNGSMVSTISFVKVNSEALNTDQL